MVRGILTLTLSLSVTRAQGTVGLSARSVGTIRDGVGPPVSTAMPAVPPKAEVNSEY